MKARRQAGARAVAALCAAATLVPAGLALAGYQPGFYSGTTEQGEEIRFRAGEWRVKRLTTVVYATCKNGERQRIDVDSGRTSIDVDRFGLHLSGPTDLAVKITGRLRDGEAWGRVEATVHPRGTTCATEVRWRAEQL